MLVIAEMVSFVEKVFTTSSVLKNVECTDCSAGFCRKRFNLVFAVVHHGQLLLSSSMFSLHTWLTEEEGVVAPPFHSILVLIKTPWPYGWKDLSHGENLAPFLLQRKSIISSYWALPSMPSNANFRSGSGGRGMLSVNAGRKDSYPPPSC